MTRAHRVRRRPGRTTALLATAIAIISGACNDSSMPKSNDATSSTSTSTTAAPSVSDAATAACRGGRAGSRTTHRYAAAPGATANAQSLDLYAPERDTECAPAPVVVYVHGGGFRNGDKANAIADKAGWFNESGWIFVSANYRLVGDPDAGTDGAEYPRQPDDIAAAVSWLVDHADDFGGNPDRITLIGHSAGAYLVALVGTDLEFLVARGVDPSALRCVVANDTETFRLADNMVDGGARSRLYRDAFGDDPVTWERASPIAHVADADAGALPRFLVVTRGSAARETNNRAMVDAVNDGGGTAELLVAEPYSHLEVNRQIGRANDTIVTPVLADFLRACD